MIFLHDLWRAMGMSSRVLAAVLGLAIAGWAAWAAYRVVDAPRRAKEAEIAARTAGAYSASSKAAIDVIVESAKRDSETAKEIQDEVERIKELPEDQRYAASLALLCGLPEYRSDSRCAQLQQPRSR